MQNEYKKVDKKKVINIIISIFAIIIMSFSWLFVGYVVGKEENNNITCNEELRESRKINYNISNDDRLNLVYNMPLNYRLNGVYQLYYQQENCYYYSLETYNYKLYYRDTLSSDLGIVITGLSYDFILNVYQLDFTPRLDDDTLTAEYNGSILVDLDRVGKNIPINQYFETNKDFLIDIKLSFYDDTDLQLQTDIKVMGGISTFYNYTYYDDNELFSHYSHDGDYEFSYMKTNSLVIYYDNLYYAVNKTYQNENAYQLGYDVGYDAAYEYAYNLGLELGSKENFGNNYFKQLFNLILNAPYNIFNGMLNFEIFGINLFSLFSFIFTTALIIFIVQLFKK